jgi:hypothetical protein
MLRCRNHIVIALANLVWILLVHEVTAAQSFSFGVKGGMGLTNTVDVSFNYTSADKRYTVGPTVEIGLPLSFAVEVSALYRRTGYDTADGLYNMFTDQRVRANSWEFPITLKYYIPLKHFPVKLHMSGGYVLRNLSGASNVIHSYGYDYQTGAPYDNTYHGATTYLPWVNPTHGVTAGGGLRLNMGFLRISPEIRYTRWSGVPFQQAGPYGSFAQSTQNQLDLLVGLTF